MFAMTVRLLMYWDFVLFRQCHQKQVVWIIKLEKFNFDLMKFHDFSEFMQLINKIPNIFFKEKSIFEMLICTQIKNLSFY